MGEEVGYFGSNLSLRHKKNLYLSALILVSSFLSNVCDIKVSAVAISELTVEPHSLWCRDQYIKHVNYLLPFFFPSTMGTRHFLNFRDGRA